MTSQPDTNGLTFRQNYFADPAGWQALVDLLQDIFDIDIGPLQQMGGPDKTSMPFGWFDSKGVLAANLSAFALPFVINGRRINAAGLQSGAVRPDWRGRGLYRDVTRKLLDWCAAEGFEALILYTDKPALYEPYGFRSLPLHRFEGAAPAAVPANQPGRSLNPTDGDDLALLQRLLAARVPVSDTLAVTGNAAMFLINTRLDPDVRVSFLPDQQAVAAWKMPRDGHFVLLDVVATKMPSLGIILGGLGVTPATAEVLFRPDKLGWEGQAVLLEGGTRLMVQGLDGVELEQPAMLSPMADF